MSATSVLIQLSSDISGTPVNNADTGDRFTVKLASPIQVDDAENYEVVVVSCDAWYSSPNILAADNIFEYVVNTTGASGALAETFTITIPTGLYSYQDLSQFLATQTADETHGSYDHPLFTITGSAATQLITVVVDASGSYVGSTYNNGTEDRTVASVAMNGTVANSVLTGLLGFDALTYTATTAGTVFTAQSLANMDRGISSYLVNCDLVAGSIGADGAASNIALKLPLSVAANSQISWENKLSTNTLSLARRRTDSISVWLTSNTGQPISLNSNPYSLTLLIRRRESTLTAEKIHKLLAGGEASQHAVRAQRNLASSSV